MVKTKQTKQQKKKRQRQSCASIHACVHSDHKKVKTLPMIQTERERERERLTEDSDSDSENVYTLTHAG